MSETPKEEIAQAETATTKTILDLGEIKIAKAKQVQDVSDNKIERNKDDMKAKDVFGKSEVAKEIIDKLKTAKGDESTIKKMLKQIFADNSATSFIDKQGNHYLRISYGDDMLDFSLKKNNVEPLFVEVTDMLLVLIGEKVSTKNKQISFTYERETLTKDIKADLDALEAQVATTTINTADSSEPSARDDVVAKREKFFTLKEPAKDFKALTGAIG